MAETFRAFLCSVAGTSDPLMLRLRGGGVRRYHTEGAAFQQSVAEHTWRAVMILLHFWPETPLQTVKAMLDHDVPEGIYGDIPAPTKRQPEIKKIYGDSEVELEAYLRVVRPTDPHDHFRMKIADYAELCNFVRAIPGQRAKRIWQKGRQYIEETLEKLPLEEQRRLREAILAFTMEEV